MVSGRLLVVLLAGCGRIGYEPLPEPREAGLEFGVATWTHQARDSGRESGRASAARDAGLSSSATDGAIATGQADASGDALVDAAQVVKEAGLPCLAPATVPSGWNFTIGSAGTPTLTGTPARFTLDVTTPTGGLTVGWLSIEGALGDLRGHSLRAAIYANGSVDAKPFAVTATEAGSVWGDSGTVPLEAGWTCLDFPIASPRVTTGPGYDASRVIRVGFELTFTKTPSSLYVERAGY